jgi:hypothetical protein
MTTEHKYYRCTYDDCKTVSYYGNINDEIPTLCESHKSNNKADFRNRRCHYINKNNIQCIRRANYGINKEIYCMEHNLYNFENINAKRCIVCKKKQPSFKKENTITLTHCTDCKNDDMIYGVKEKCVNCKIKIPTYNTPDNTKPSHCADCKTDDMINVKHKKCIKCNTKIASFNYKNEHNALYCGDCKEDDMMNVLNRKCSKCKIKIPAFNYENEKMGLYCNDCKEESMINVISPRCIVCNKTRPCFGLKDTKELTHCKKCKTTDMINLVSIKCIKCKNLIASFNYKNIKKAKYCYSCKEEDMVNVTANMCKACNIVRANFGLKGTTMATHCYSCHDKNTMINLYMKKCIVCNKTSPSYGIIGSNIRTHCSICREENMINIVSPRCKEYMCDIIISNDKYDGYCLRCYIYNNPNGKVCRNYKTKEKSVVDYICNNFSEYKITTDKVILGGCSNRRPDILIDLNTHVIIIEIDEDQHITYDNECENKRLMEISQDLGHPHIIFIRFNPDKYMINDEIIKSCWYINKKGICVIKDKKEWDIRLMCLKNIVQYWLNNIPDKHITLVHLFYNIKV